MRREVVKDRTTRSVARVIDDDGTDVHVKSVLLAHHPLRRLSALFGRNKVAREARQLQRLAELGIRAPEVVSTDTRRRFGIPIELTLTTRTLAGFTSPKRAGPEDVVFARDLGRFVRMLHDRGTFHDDFHRGNVLRDAGGSFALVDADRVRFVPNPSAAERWRGILKVLLGFRELREDPACAAFFDSYGTQAFGFATRDLLDDSEAAILRHCRARSVRALRENPDFGFLVRGGVGWQVRRGFEPPVDVAAAQASAAATYKVGRSSTVAALDATSVLKAFHPWRLRGRLSAFIRGSRARRAFRNGHLLELLGIRTPRVLAFADRGTGKPGGPSLLITERITPGEPAGEFLARGPDRYELVRFLESVGTLVGRLHRDGFSHRDLKGRNLLREGAGTAVLVDLDGLRDPRRLSEARRMNDLARIVRAGLESRGSRLSSLAVLIRAYQQALLGRQGRTERRSLINRLLLTRPRSSAKRDGAKS